MGQALINVLGAQRSRVWVCWVAGEATPAVVGTGAVGLGPLPGRSCAPGGGLGGGLGVIHVEENGVKRRA